MLHTHQTRNPDTKPDLLRDFWHHGVETPPAWHSEAKTTVRNPCNCPALPLGDGVAGRRRTGRPHLPHPYVRCYQPFRFHCQTAPTTLSCELALSNPSPPGWTPARIKTANNCSGTWPAQPGRATGDCSLPADDPRTIRNRSQVRIPNNTETGCSGGIPLGPRRWLAGRF